MNPVVESLTGTAGMTDQVIAADLLIACKAGVRDYATAISETASPRVRSTLRRHLDDAINFHEQVFNYMEDKGWYNAHDITKQVELDIRNADTALNL